ncbi:unnamed protein product [Dicrocoelium dendriticum]|nr:unnamed protein product [Dicrocoelium dendriticum]
MRPLPSAPFGSSRGGVLSAIFCTSQFFCSPTSPLQWLAEMHPALQSINNNSQMAQRTPTSGESPFDTNARSFLLSTILPYEPRFTSHFDIEGLLCSVF